MPSLRKERERVGHPRPARPLQQTQGAGHPTSAGAWTPAGYILDQSSSGSVGGVLSSRKCLAFMGAAMV